jgi:hypothetical protein
MSVTSVDKAQKAATGHAKSDEVTYDAPYIVKVSSAADGPATIFAYLRANSSQPWLGRSFSYGNDSDVSAICKEISQPQRAKGHDGLWTFDAKYSTKLDSSDQKPDNNGEPTDVPMDWRPEVRVSRATHEQPCDKAIYRGGFLHAIPIATIGLSYCPMNSALQVYDPPLVKDFSRLTFSCRFWRQFYNADQAQMLFDSVNSDAVTFQSYIPIIGTFGQYTLKVGDIRGNPQRESRELFGVRVMLDYYEIEMEVQYNRDGWREKVVDRGNRRIIQEGQLDGFGGSISMTDIISGKQAPNAVILGKDGHPVASPILLDGAGNALVDNRNPIQITWQKYVELFYSADPYLQTFFTF